MKNKKIENIVYKGKRVGISLYTKDMDKEIIVNKLNEVIDELNKMKEKIQSGGDK